MMIQSQEFASKSPNSSSGKSQHQKEGCVLTLRQLGVSEIQPAHEYT